MRTTVLSLLFALCWACGGASPEAKAPTTEPADPAPASAASPSPSPASSPVADPPKSEPIKTSAVSKTSDGSDIVPPFTTTAEPASKDADKDADKPAPAPAKKKAKAKAKKKTN